MMLDCFSRPLAITHEVFMTDAGSSENDVKTAEPESADKAVDQKNLHTDNDNEFSPGFKPNPDRPAPGEDTDADIDTDGG
jgi:hypothetical protein